MFTKPIPLSPPLWHSATQTAKMTEGFNVWWLPLNKLCFHGISHYQSNKVETSNIIIRKTFDCPTLPSPSSASAAPWAWLFEALLRALPTLLQCSSRWGSRSGSSPKPTAAHIEIAQQKKQTVRLLEMNTMTARGLKVNLCHRKKSQSNQKAGADIDYHSMKLLSVASV